MDEEVLVYLYTLFWTWDNTLTKIIHEAMLVDDLRTGLDGVATLKEAGQIEFCSEYLINSILALSTIYVLQSDLCITPTGRVFADEALRLLEVEETKPSLPFLQGTAILAVYKLSIGETATATYLLEKLHLLPSPMEWLAACPLPNDNTASLRAQDTRTAIACIWGFYCLDAKLGLLLNRQMVLRKPLLAERISDGADSHRRLWLPHPLSSPSCLSYSAEAFVADCAFAELAREALLQISANRACLVPDYSSTKDLSYRMIKAKVSMGEMVKGDGHHLPRRMFLFLSYYTTSIRLLEPFVQLSFLGFEGGQTAASLSLANSNAIVSTLWNYRTAFGMRHEYWMLYACQVAAMAMLVHPQSMCLQGESFVRVCQLLTSIAEKLPMADVGVSVLIRFISLKDIDIPAEARQLLNAGRQGEESNYEIH
ncbi:fungal specific transcription factor, putative [Beauveria bassiana ARSEF 2860]|uniref:Fungal specific transcription factor, putative n=1 Tax=Beauveria bassiana (strain ARSEF 2860) TaxID=655819 RepID=J4KL36_BEAB2|nr:fungal specific transcription factor, putative [Beauveria bassiana ARSEF 2860]EJP61519.1 fungal specific transcription factor, putative [Beauveria bassiana ARSEF 2860]